MTNLTSILDDAKTRLDRWQHDFAMPTTNRLDVAISPADLPAAVAALADWGYLIAITGLDHRDTLEALYHFGAGAAVVTLRVGAPRADGVLPSLCAAIPSAGVFEREISEMFGVTFAGAPETSRLFLPDDWTEGVYPLLKDAALPKAKGGAS